MGGTEATVVRVADALGALVAQHNRTSASGRYQPPGSDPAITHVIVNRDSRALPAVRELYPNARVHLWLHDRVRPRSKRARRLAADADVLRELAVKRDLRFGHVSGTRSRRRSVGCAWATASRACTIYNPVDDELQPDGSPVDTASSCSCPLPTRG